MAETTANGGRTDVFKNLGSTLIYLGLLFFSAGAFADANDGEYLGFKLGDRYAVPRGSVGKSHITGALSYAIDPEHRHQHMGSMSLYVSPKTHTIGSIFGEWYFSGERSAREFSERYKRSLEERYSHWKRRRSYLTNGEYQLWVDVEQRSPFADSWPFEKKFRVSVALIYWPDSGQRAEWLARLVRETSNQELVAKK